MFKLSKIFCSSVETIVDVKKPKGSALNTVTFLNSIISFSSGVCCYDVTWDLTCKLENRASSWPPNSQRKESRFILLCFNIYSKKWEIAYVLYLYIAMLLVTTFEVLVLKCKISFIWSAIINLNLYQIKILLRCQSRLYKILTTSSKRENPHTLKTTPQYYIKVLMKLKFN